MKSQYNKSRFYVYIHIFKQKYLTKKLYKYSSLQKSIVNKIFDF